MLTGRIGQQKHSALPSTADEARASARRFRITHPFHPQAGSEFPLVKHRRNWSEDRIYFPRPDGKLTSVPAGWTSVCAPDPFSDLPPSCAPWSCLLRLQPLPTTLLTPGVPPSPGRPPIALDIAPGPSCSRGRSPSRSRPAPSHNEVTGSGSQKRRLRCESESTRSAELHAKEPVYGQ